MRWVGSVVFFLHCFALFSRWWLIITDYFSVSRDDAPDDFRWLHVTRKLKDAVPDHPETVRFTVVLPINSLHVLNV